MKAYSRETQEFSIWEEISVESWLKAVEQRCVKESESEERENSAGNFVGWSYCLESGNKGLIA